MLLVANLANTKSCKKPEKLTVTLVYGYLSENTQRELSNEYQHDRVLDGFQRSLHPCPLDESSLSFGRVNSKFINYKY